ncbi:Slp family lipoprotein, partial [Salmonella enterica subsp. enterica serovar Kentucky]|nr:Slp family lipoprotein [Salmonella enterica subsp. enterica serovar Kentucky]
DRNKSIHFLFKYETVKIFIVNIVTNFTHKYRRFFCGYPGKSFLQNQQGKTRLEIATVPLDSGARPVLGEASRGRIFADVNGFLDP